MSGVQSRQSQGSGWGERGGAAHTRYPMKAVGAFVVATVAGLTPALATPPFPTSLGPLQATEMVADLSGEGGSLYPAAGWYGIWHGRGHPHLYARPIGGGQEVALRIFPPLADNSMPFALVVTSRGFLVSGYRKREGEDRLQTVTLRFDRSGRLQDIYAFGSRGYTLHVAAGDELPDGRLVMVWVGTRSPTGKLEVGAGLFDPDLKPLKDLVPALQLSRSESNVITRLTRCAVRRLGDHVWVVDALAGRIMLLSLEGELLHTVQAGLPGSNETIVGWAPASNGVHLLLIRGMELPANPAGRPPDPPCWQQRLLTLGWDGRERESHPVVWGRGLHPSCPQQVALWMFPDGDASHVIWELGNLWRGRWQSPPGP